jgi:hypothetical protein
MAVKHSAYSARLVSAKAEELRARLLDKVPWLVNADPVVMDRLCRAEPRSAMLHE